MKYPILLASEAKKFLSSLRTDSPLALREQPTARGEGAALDETFITDLRSDLQKVREAIDGQVKGASGIRKFEAAAASVVHRRIPFDPMMVADADFWRWLAVYHFRSLIEWRYGKPAGEVNLPNFGVGSAPENFIYRLWLQAELTLDEGARDRYHLSRRGDVDFWRSHMFRPAYSNARPFARALVRFQYPDASPEKPRLKIPEIRKLAVRLSRLRANTFFELLDDAAAMAVIEREAAVVKSA